MVRVLISTAGIDTLVVEPFGCPPSVPGITPSLTCPQSRGELFDSSLSETWSSIGNYSLGLDVNLGAGATGTYGFDTVALGSNNATGGPTLQRQVVASMSSNNIFTGLFGLGNQPTNFTASNDFNNLTGTTPYSSFLTTMKSQNLIPSLSWAYTAGAIYSECISTGSARSTLSLCYSLCSSGFCATKHDLCTRAGCSMFTKALNDQTVYYRDSRCCVRSADLDQC